MSNIDICKQLFKAIGKGDVAIMKEMIEPDFVIRQATGLPYGGEYTGIEGWLTLLQKVGGTWADFKPQRPNFLAETADSVIMQMAFSGKSRKTGKAFESSVLEIWSFRNGRLKQIQPYYFDTHLLATSDTE